MKETITVGQVTFKNETIYSRDDKKRDKARYVAKIKGLTLAVGNTNPYKSGVYFDCPSIGLNNLFFTNKAITIEAACAHAIKHVKTRLTEILSVL
jgi:hypothetical protein